MQIVETFREKVDLPNILYKYRNWESVYDKEVLYNGQLYYSSPRDFEDNNDCAAIIRYDCLTDEMIYKAYLQRSQEDNERFIRRQHRKFARDWVKKTPLRDNKWVNEQQGKHREEYFDIVGILSLTFSPNNFDMWVKYSNNFKGICYGFYTDVLISKAGGGAKVIYEKKLPKILPEPFNSFEEQLFKRVYIKEDIWVFEDEYGLKKLWKGGASTVDRQMNYGNKAITEVILGQDIKKDSKQEIVTFIEKNCPQIKIFIATYDKKQTVKLIPFE